ncbi:sugar ABC transporter ATP-binding protein [Trinickia acidisoli]|uniref:sugar ABC transporter ATP-binding protein n=1 Tax=Trinickia acidisoli TaxID=2767482 RepID=UPI001A8C8DEF|nr:sugar ABC transporter ATP-binding protein [Trinickia acidisoli]
MTTLFDESSAPARVALRGVSKAFGRTQALSRVTLTGAPGSVHAITGENGAGKSTLMKLLAGVHTPDEGEILLDGECVHLGSPGQARRAGVSTVFQELTVLPNLSVAENLCLGREPRRYGLLDRAGLHRAAADVLERAGIDLDGRKPCTTLTVAQQQLLEVAKGLVSDARVFIFDEPTAPLNAAEVDKLEHLIARLKREGKLVFYISHRLDEIFRFCDTVSVMKDGRHVATHCASDLTEDELIRLMVGRELTALFPPRRAERGGAIALDVGELTVRAGAAAVSFDVRLGEIVGIAGLEGHGQREIMRALAGIERPEHSEIRLTDEQGTPRRFNPGGGPRAAVRQGLALMPEDRKTEGLYLDLTVQENIWHGALRGVALWRRARRDQRLIGRTSAAMRLRCRPTDTVGSLSGGNQQKVMLGRWLAAGIRVLLVEQPTRGVDIGAKAEIYGLLREFTAQGGAVVAVSGDLLELIGLCDRILVVRDGALVADLPAEHATEEQVLTHALREASTADGRAAAVTGDAR